MLFFCLLWILLFYFFRRSIANAGTAACTDGIVWALPLGVANAFLNFFTGVLIMPGGFGFSRWMSGFMDIVCLPVLVPLAVCLLLIAFRVLPGNVDITGFIMLWLIPLSVLRSISWSLPGIPVMLVLVPILWTALATGIPILLACAKQFSRWYVIVPVTLGIAALPVTAATSWWAFYCHIKLTGYLLLIATLIPVTVWTIVSLVQLKRKS